MDEIVRAYKHGMPLELLAKQFNMSIHRAIEILSWKLVEEKRDEVLSKPKRR
jgi:hypothetical protein